MYYVFTYFLILHIYYIIYLFIYQILCFIFYYILKFDLLCMLWPGINSLSFSNMLYQYVSRVLGDGCFVVVPITIYLRSSVTWWYITSNILSSVILPVIFSSIILYCIPVIRSNILLYYVPVIYCYITFPYYSRITQQLGSRIMLLCYVLYCILYYVITVFPLYLVVLLSNITQ